MTVQELREQIAHAETLLDSTPSDVRLAMNLWLLYGRPERNIRSGPQLVKVFRAPAISGIEGQNMLCEAFRNLSYESGEFPRADLFDQQLIQVLQSNRHRSDAIHWLLTQLEREDGEGKKTFE